jgi:hypothetical protein
LLKLKLVVVRLTLETAMSAPGGLLQAAAAG